MKRLSGWNSARLANFFIALIMVLVPFQAFLTVWGSTLLGHYTALRLWDDIVLFLLAGITCITLVRSREERIWLTSSLLVRLIATYVGLMLLLGAVSYLKSEVTLKAFAYGVLIDVRFLVWFLVVLLGAQRSTWLQRAWAKLLLFPALIVVVFAVLQYTLLPHNFLSHFGYNPATTIAPIETINHNNNYIRVQSTLRGANPLGAYLVVVISALTVLFFRGRRKVACAVFGAMTLLALYASGSRSAWIGTILSLSIVVFLWLRNRRARTFFGVIFASVLVLAVGVYGLLKDNVSLENEVLHTQIHSAVKTTSDGAHTSALKNGIDDVLHQPLGDGPGTAGPASIYNGSHPPRIAENYYIQIAQETGWLGISLFLAILALVIWELYEQIHVSCLTLLVFSSLGGVVFINMLSHAWADDTLAFVWWGLAGIALARQPEGRS